ncbi:unannotated protein [freshwater metagenome]|uniref:Unannotated protein n=1 Tax=freshwater metagenome TaxID=449393 RepID=A0A6J7D3R6_9ZZZZ
MAERRHGRRHLPRHVHDTLRRATPSDARHPHVDLGRRRHRSMPQLGNPLRDRCCLGHHAYRRSMGAQPRRSLHVVHGWHHRHAQGCDVAPGRRDRQPRCRLEATAARCARLGQTRAASLQARPAQPARRTAHARHRGLQRDVEPVAGRLGGHHAGPPLRSRRAARHHPARSRQQHVHRWRRVRQAAVACARRRAVSLGHLVVARHRVERRDVVIGIESRPAAPQRTSDHDRQPRQQRGHWYGQQHHHRRRCRQIRHVRAVGPHQGAHRRRPRGRARQRRARARGAARPHPHWLLQGPREIGLHVRHVRGRALEHPRRFRRGRGRWRREAAGSR